MPSRTRGRIDVISDVICPWCYIGKRQLDRALDLLATQDQRFTVGWHPFQLNPDMPAEGVDRDEYRIAKFGSLARSRKPTSGSPRPPSHWAWNSTTT